MRDRTAIDKNPQKEFYSEGGERGKRGRRNAKEGTKQEKTENMRIRLCGFSALFSSLHALHCENASCLDSQLMRSCVCPATSAPSPSKIGNVRLDQVTFPSLKVHMFDTFQRHGRRQLFFAHPDTVQPVLQFDSSVPDRRTKDVGYGWQPNFPASPASTSIFYTLTSTNPQPPTAPPPRSSSAATAGPEAASAAAITATKSPACRKSTSQHIFRTWLTSN